MCRLSRRDARSFSLSPTPICPSSLFRFRTTKPVQQLVPGRSRRQTPRAPLRRVSGNPALSRRRQPQRMGRVGPLAAWSKVPGALEARLQCRRGRVEESDPEKGPYIVRSGVCVSTRTRLAETVLPTRVRLYSAVGRVRFEPRTLATDMAPPKLRNGPINVFAVTFALSIFCFVGRYGIVGRVGRPHFCF